MKIAAAVVVILALVIGLVPQFTDCESQGRTLKTSTGMTVSMKCHWTARAELAMAVPLVGVGAVMGFSRRKEGRRILSAIGVLLGAFVILLPTSLIGVCANPDMLCNSIMKPTLILSGVLIIGASVATWLFSERQPELAA